MADGGGGEFSIVFFQLTCSPFPPRSDPSSNTDQDLVVHCIERSPVPAIEGFGRRIDLVVHGVPDPRWDLLGIEGLGRPSWQIVLSLKLRTMLSCIVQGQDKLPPRPMASRLLAPDGFQMAVAPEPMRWNYCHP
jgi:hypothetical protein